MNTIGTLKLEVQKVDGETRVAAFVDGVWKQDLDIHSQMTIKEAKECLREQWQAGNLT